MSPSPYRILLAGWILLSACGNTSPRIALAELDYAEVANTTGWQLRIYGDGSASLSHEQLPAHHLNYPVGTFSVRPARRIVAKCRQQLISPVCTSIKFYSSSANELEECPCATKNWAEEVMEQAIDEMQLAIDAGASERSCRMLLRQWLAAR
jgi:hypothetical protein